MIKNSRFKKILWFWLSISVIAVGLSGCSMSKERQQYFQEASCKKYQFQQIPATSTHPAEYVVCGSKEHPCLQQTPLSGSYKHYSKIGAKHYVK